MNRAMTYALAALTALAGGGSLVLFGYFLLAGPPALFRLEATEARMLIWDGLLSLLFFLQHSGMVRASFRARLSGLLPPPYQPALYTIVSGLTLAAVVLLWQATPSVLVSLPGPLRWLARAATLLALAGFGWAVRALSSFDPFGLSAFLSSAGGQPSEPPRLVIRGPYQWMRHPLYFFSLVLIWSAPDVGLDRLLFNGLWTLWIVIASRLEEKDLLARFGESYRRYQERVPRLLPWRGPAGRGL